MKKAKRKGNVVPNNYFWISVEGTDAVGKTSLVRKISHIMRGKKNLEVVTIKEFSKSKVGRLIKNIIKKQRFFSLKNGVHYPLAETLLLCSDFFYQFEEVLSKNRHPKKTLFLISDRGIHSFLTYQILRIAKKYKKHPEYFKKWVKDIFYPLRQPDLVIILTSPISQIRNRIIKRDGLIKEDEIRFIKTVQEEYIKLFKKDHFNRCLLLENRDNNFNSLIKKVSDELDKIIY